ncbi:unnamed protein product [Parnassius mnemosyne]|uniref:Cytochrome b-c1 complex subunit 8 n=1 Tax=Parnassius mnemosyne TaxID=213953 RepID=A0AAV1K615_9NEOP
MKQFGNLAYIRGILYFRLSPYEQKAFAGAFKKGLPNLVPRTFMTLPYWLPPFLIAGMVYHCVEEAYRKSKRKNPKDYIDEVDPNPPPPPVIETKEKCS